MEHLKNTDEEQHEGEHYLEMLGLESMADNDIAVEGKTIKARDFLEICGTHARPVLIGFESMDPNDPKYEPTKVALRSMIGQYIGLESKD